MMGITSLSVQAATISHSTCESGLTTVGRFIVDDGDDREVNQANLQLDQSIEEKLTANGFRLSTSVIYRGEFPMERIADLLGRLHIVAQVSHYEDGSYEGEVKIQEIYMSDGELKANTLFERDRMFQNEESAIRYIKNNIPKCRR